MFVWPWIFSLSLSPSLFLSMRKYITLQNAVIFRLKSFHCLTLDFVSPHMHGVSQNVLCVLALGALLPLPWRSSLSLSRLDIARDIALRQHISMKMHFNIIWKCFKRIIQCMALVEREIVKVFMALGYLLMTEVWGEY